jgi:hypothetical protein
MLAGRVVSRRGNNVSTALGKGPGMEQKLQKWKLTAMLRLLPFEVLIKH